MCVCVCVCVCVCTFCSQYKISSLDFSNALVVEVGPRQWTVPCVSPYNPTSTKWATAEGTVVAMALGNEVDLRLTSINDSLHHQRFTCYGLTVGDVVYQLHLTIIVQGEVWD